MLELQLVVLQGRLRSDQLVVVVADLCFQLGEVAGGDASGVEQFLSAFKLFPADFQCRFVHLHGFGGIKYLHVELGDVFLDGVFALVDGEFGHAAVQLLLFERVHPFASVVHGPVCIDAVASVVRGFAFAGGDVVAADDGAARAVRTVHDTLADITAQGREEIRFCRLHIFLGAFDVDAVSTNSDIMLQCIIDTITKRPLLRHVVFCFHPGRQEKQTREDY